MGNQPLWIVRIDQALDQINADYATIDDAHDRIRDGYRGIAENIIGAIVDAKRAGQSLTQSEVAKHIGKSPTWVSRVLKWHQAGCRSESPFGDEIATRRAVAKLESSIATSQSEALMVNELDLGQLCLLRGHSDYIPGRREATLDALSLLGACQTLTKVAASTRTDSLARIRPTSDEKRLFTLERLAAELEQSILAGRAALDEVQATLKKRPRL